MNDERKYVDWDEHVAAWCIFDTETGFCFGSFSDELTAQESLANG